VNKRQALSTVLALVPVSRPYELGRDSGVSAEVQTRRRKTNTPGKYLTSVFLIILSLLFFKYEKCR
jgi:hypothetical protein